MNVDQPDNKLKEMVKLIKIELNFFAIQSVIKIRKLKLWTTNSLKNYRKVSAQD